MHKELIRTIKYGRNQWRGLRTLIMVRNLIPWIVLAAVVCSCESELHDSHWNNNENSTICE